MHKANPDTSWLHGGVIHGWTLNISCSLKLIVYKARNKKATFSPSLATPGPPLIPRIAIFAIREQKSLILSPHL